MNARQEVWITGVGLITCLGEGLEANWQHLARGDPPAYDDKSFAPYIVHPLAPVNFDKQIPKKSDQRQMEPWQRIGVARMQIHPAYQQRPVARGQRGQIAPAKRSAQDGVAAALADDAPRTSRGVGAVVR